jgi:pimeloyl-ACP methyl ester carboxylesterase
MKKIILILLIPILLTGCVSDIYQIRKGERKQVFIPSYLNNSKGHLFWYAVKDQNGKFVRDNNKRVLFDKNRNTIIYVHGWQGVGVLGWTNHSLTTRAPLFALPVTALISMMYNVPSNGATFPSHKERITEFNFANFDWQLYNNTESQYENSEDLATLEEYLKKNPYDWPLIPKNLADEIELFVKKTGYEKEIILAAHSIGNQVVLRAYKLLSDETRKKISKIVFLDPFTSDHFDYMNIKTSKDLKWLTGFKNPTIKNELNSLIQSSDIKEKLSVIISTDIGESWVYYFAKPNDLIVIDKDQQQIKLDALYGSRSKKYHELILDWFFSEKRYDKDIGLTN